MSNSAPSWYKTLGQYLYLASSLSLQMAVVLLLPKLLARTDYAIVVYSQAFAIWGALLIEYGFSFSATRSIAKKPNEASVISHKVRMTNYTLAFFFIIFAPVLANCLPLLENNLELIVTAVSLALVQGLTPWWYFQATQAMYRLVFFDLASSIVVVVIWCMYPDSALMILSIQLCGKALPMMVGQYLLWRDVKGQVFNIRDVIDELVHGFSLFFFMLSTALYTTLNVLILGFYVAPKDIAIFVIAEKMIRLAVRFWEPLNRAFYPKSVMYYIEKKQYFLIFVKRIFWFYLLSAVVIFVLGVLLGEWFILYVLGSAFYQSVAIFCILILAIPLIAISNVLGILYLLPSGRDKLFNTIIIFSGIFHVVLSVVLIKQYDILGMAMAVVITEALVAGAMLLMVYYDTPKFRCAG